MPASRLTIILMCALLAASTAFGDANNEAVVQALRSLSLGSERLHLSATAIQRAWPRPLSRHQATDDSDMLVFNYGENGVDGDYFFLDGETVESFRIARTFHSREEAVDFAERAAAAIANGAKKPTVMGSLEEPEDFSRMSLLWHYETPSTLEAAFVQADIFENDSGFDVSVYFYHSLDKRND